MLINLSSFIDGQGSICEGLQQQAGDVLPFYAGSRLAIVAGRLKGSIPDEFLNAWSTLAGARLSTETADAIMHDRANPQIAEMFSVKPIFSATLNAMGRYYQMVRRWVQTNA